MTDLADFLLARIAEDKATAEASCERGYQPGWEWLADLGVNYEHRTHIAQWDPARVLAECQARRRIVERYVKQCRQVEAGLALDPENLAGYVRGLNALDWVVRVLAVPYADHPGYRQEWRP